MKVENWAPHSPAPLISIEELTKDSKNVTLFGTIDSVTVQKAVDGTATELTLCLSDRTGSVLSQLWVGEKSALRWQNSFQVGDLLRVTGDGFAEGQSGELRFCVKEMSVFPIEDAKTLRQIVWDEARNRFGEPLPAPVENRLEKEWTWIEEKGEVPRFALARRMISFARAQDCYLSDFVTCVSLVAFFAGITEYNPLPPHYVCPNCRHSEWPDDGTAYTGLDLLEKTCPACGAPLRRDGYRFPIEYLIGSAGSRKIRFCLEGADRELREKLKEFLPAAKNAPADALYVIGKGFRSGILRTLERTTGVSARDVPLSDAAVLSLFTSPRALGVSATQIGSETGTVALPTFGAEPVRDLLSETHPQTVADLFKLTSYLSGEHIVNANLADDLRRTKTHALSDLIAYREDLLEDLLAHGVDLQTAFEIMRSLANGCGITEAQEAVLRAAGLPEWYIVSCKNVKNLPSKCRAARYLLPALALGWYKIHFPAEYYASYFSYLNSFDDYLTHIWLAEERRQAAREATARGVRFLLPDPLKSHATEFLPENGALRLPLSAITPWSGIAESTALPQEQTKTLWEIVWNRAQIRWGRLLPIPVAERLEKERTWIEESGSAELFSLLYRMTALAREEGCPITARDVGASLIAFLAGLTEIDPLPPHYVCPICRHSEWYDDGTAYIGFDLPEKTCPECGAPMLRDGYRIPAESFFSRVGSKNPQFTVNAAAEIQPKLHDLLTGAENVPETAIRIFDEGEKLGILRKLERATGVLVRDISPDDKALIRRSVPLFRSDFLRNMFAVAQPQNLSELIRFFGLSLGQKAWKDNADELLKAHACSLADVVAVREDIFYALCDRGVETETATDIMKSVSRDDRILTEEQVAIIRSAGLPDQYADSCRKIRYLSGKTLAVGYALTDLRLAWYQIHFPTEYAACSDEQEK